MIAIALAAVTVVTLANAFAAGRLFADSFAGCGEDAGANLDCRNAPPLSEIHTAAVYATADLVAMLAVAIILTFGLGRLARQVGALRILGFAIAMAWVPFGLGAVLWSLSSAGKDSPLLAAALFIAFVVAWTALLGRTVRRRASPPPR